MAAIRPFHGLRYTPAAGALDTLIAPPYDVLSPSERDALAAKNPFNVVHLTLPEAKPDDRSKFIKYARSAALLSEWRREGALRPDPEPAIYRYRQTFRLPGHPSPITRTAIIALLHVEPFEAGVVLPHERTFPKHKEDRLRILEATRAHLETIFGLYEDEDLVIGRHIESAPVIEFARATGEDGVQHEIGVIQDPTTLEALASLMRDKKIWIADGHHRYETALGFRQALGERTGQVPEDFIPIALTSMSDPGLVLLPTHRIVGKFPLSPAEILGKLESRFEITETPKEAIFEVIERLGAGGKQVFGLAIAGGAGYVLVPKDPPSLLAEVESGDTEDLRRLDVSVLHSVVFERLLGLTSLEAISYTRDPAEALQAVENGASMVWLMNPPTVDDMKRIALGSERMPQKSTYYYPKIESGLVLWSLNDF